MTTQLIFVRTGLHNTSCAEVAESPTGLLLRGKCAIEKRACASCLQGGLRTFVNIEPMVNGYVALWHAEGIN